MVNVMFTEELYKDLIKYKNIYENMVEVKKRLDDFIFEDPNKQISAGSKLENDIYSVFGGYTVKDKAYELEERLNIYKSGLERVQNKYPELDLRYLTELKSEPYTVYYNYSVYAKKQKDGDVVYIADFNESEKLVFVNKNELIQNFSDMYSYLHKEKTQEEVLNFFEKLFKYLD